MALRESPVEGLVMDRDFWKNKKVLITGHTGFKGSWLSLWLQSAGADLAGYSLSPPTKPSLFETAGVSKGMLSVTGDVCDLEHLKSVVREYKPEIIIHMAAKSLVRYSYNNPVETYSTNVMGTVNVLEAVRQVNCARAVLIVTSDKCYKNNEWQWGYRENEPMGGFDPYSSSKGCAELIVDAFRNSYFSVKDYDLHGVAVSSVRAGNVIGGGDWSEDRLIPDIVKAIIEKRTVMIRNPDAIRPWQHVLDPLNGYLRLCEQMWNKGKEFAGAWNFGPNDEDAKSVSWIVEALIDNWGEGASWQFDRETHPHEASYLRLDCSKARNILRWQPKMNISMSLNHITHWYKNFLDDKDMRHITLVEIDHFENMR